MSSGVRQAKEVYLDPATVSAQRQGLNAICSINSATYTYQRLAQLVHVNRVENSAGDHLYRVLCSSDFREDGTGSRT